MNTNELPIDQLFCGDAVELSREKLPDDSIDGIATDPPYGLEFMGKEWDKFEPGRLKTRFAGKERKFFGNFKMTTHEIHLPQLSIKNNPRCKKCGKLRWGRKISICHCERPDFDFGTLKHSKIYQEWTTSWAKEALRALKPGASMLVMGGTRTYHRMACGVEDAGFIIKDCLAWCYNSGFPKAQDLGKMIDRRKGTTPHKSREFADCIKNRRLELKIGLTEMDKEVCGGTTNYSWFEGRPAGQRLPREQEYVIIKRILKLDDRFDNFIGEAEREIIGRSNHKSGIANETKGHYTVGGTKAEFYDVTTPATALAKKWDGWKVGGLKPAYEPILWTVKPPEGSYIDNVLRHGVGAVNVDGCRIPFEDDEDKETAHNNALGPIERYKTYKMIYGGGRKSAGFSDTHNPQGRYPANMIRTDRFHDGYDRFYFVPKASRGERDMGLDSFGEISHSVYDRCAKCGGLIINKGKRPSGCTCDVPQRVGNKVKNIHPTVKPVALMEHLIRLITREGQIVLDPFVGSGTTCIAARKLLRHYIGFDNNSDYIEIAKHRLAAVPKSLEAYSERIEV